MSCREASALLSFAEERPLTRSERWRLRLHLVVCGTCRRFQTQLAFIRHMLAAAPINYLEAVHADSGQLSPERTSRIKALLRELSQN